MGVKHTMTKVMKLLTGQHEDKSFGFVYGKAKHVEALISAIEIDR